MTSQVRSNTKCFTFPFNAFPPQNVVPGSASHSAFTFQRCRAPVWPMQACPRPAHDRPVIRVLSILFLYAPPMQACPRPPHDRPVIRVLSILFLSIVLWSCRTAAPRCVRSRGVPLPPSPLRPERRLTGNRRPFPAAQNVSYLRTTTIHSGSASHSTFTFQRCRAPVWPMQACPRPPHDRPVIRVLSILFLYAPNTAKRSVLYEHRNTH